MNEVRGKMKFLCWVAEGRNLHGKLKCPSSFDAFFGPLNLEIIGLHLPNNRTWLGRYVSASETIEEIESLMEYFEVKPWYLFALEYIGGTEFEVEIFNDFAVEVNYYGSVKRGRRPQTHLPSSGDGVFEISEIEKDKLHASFAYNVCSAYEREHDFLITHKNLQEEDYNKVVSKEQAADMGLNPEIDWIEMAFKKFAWRINLQWKDGEVLFDKGWNMFTKDCKLVDGDRCLLQHSTTAQRFEVAIYDKERSSDIYKKGGVEGKGILKWFKIINWMSVHTGEVDVPYLFAEAYGSSISKSAKLVLPDGLIVSCYYSKTANLLYGIKNLMIRYNVHQNFKFFFEYIGHSTFYATIYNEEGMGIFNNLPEKYSSNTAKNLFQPEVHDLSDCDEEDDSITVRDQSICGISNTTQNNAEMRSLEVEGCFDFSIVLLRSHVDQNNHGVYLPRNLIGLYQKWKKGTVVKLVMDSKDYNVGILRRKKTCRLGVGWNEFTKSNHLQIGQRLTFTFNGNTTFTVSMGV